MNSLPFDKPGRWWRANLHSHTTASDGSKPAEAVCAFYRSAGYHVLSITDHFLARYNFPITDARACHTETFITLPGAELHAGSTRGGEMWHILAVGLPYDFPPTTDDETGSSLAARAMQAGAFVACAHPAWYALSEDDVLELGDVHAIETINGISADHNDRIDSWYMLDVMLARGRRYFALATDDTHFHARHHDLLRGWAWIKSETLTPEAILDALKAGHYYNSTGPQFETVEIDSRRVYLRCTPCSHVFVTGKGSQAVYLHGNGLTEAEVSLERIRSPYFRITIRDRFGERAWSNPVFRD
jgi:hypothetical protein